MPRRPSVRYWSSRKGYCVKVNGTQHLLASGPDDFGTGNPPGPCYLAAQEAFKRLLEKGNLDTAGDGNTVRAVLDSYLQHAETKDRASTFRLKLQACRLFADRWGELPCAQVKPFHAEQVIAERRQERTSGKQRKQRVKWGDGSVRIFIQYLKAGFNWAVRQELIARNPLHALQPPPDRTRSRERVLTPEEHARVLATLTQPRSTCLRRLVLALENTGARPGELVNAKVGDWRAAIGALVYYRDDARRVDEFAHKTSGKKDRVIFFTGEALEMMRTLAKGKPPGALFFPANHGERYSDDGLVSCFVAIRKRTGLQGFCAYTYRHTFATAWLTQGRSIETLAELMGNTAATIRRHYNHLCHQHEALRSQLEEFRGT